MSSSEISRQPLMLPLSSCLDAGVVGGKAAALGHLLREGFDVPPGWCLTVHAYEEMEAASGQKFSSLFRTLLEKSEHERQEKIKEVQARIKAWSLLPHITTEIHSNLETLQASFPEMSGWGWAVRSSATAEDGPGFSYAGVFKTSLGVTQEEIPRAVLSCWASVWSLAMITYQSLHQCTQESPKMAVIIQPMLNPEVSGVAFSSDPMTGQRDRIFIDAVCGLAEPLVEGTMSPDHYVVACDSTRVEGEVITEHLGAKSMWRRIRKEGSRIAISDERLPREKQSAPAISELEIKNLVKVVRALDQTRGCPVDVEWAFESNKLWILQARPMTQGTSKHADQARNFGRYTWSRANLKETLPEVPSPLALDFLTEYMESAIMRNYREVGCRLPTDVPTIRIVNGRPYINVSLFQVILIQLWSDPQLVTEQMGGERVTPPQGARPLSWWRLAVTGCRILWRMGKARRMATHRFEELRKTGDTFKLLFPHRQAQGQISRMIETVREQMPNGDLTFAIGAGVSQYLTVIGELLKKRVPEGWRSLLNRATQGLGGIISAQQVNWLHELARKARHDSEYYPLLVANTWQPQQILQMTLASPFRQSFDAYLSEYGHRAIGESDVMTPRFSERPEYILEIIRGYLLAGESKSGEEVMGQQALSRQQALKEIRQAFGWRIHEWLWFRSAHTRLSTYCELREANRHWLIYYLAGFRKALGRLGELWVEGGHLECPEDVFFLTQDELLVLLKQPNHDWMSLVRERRKDREKNVVKRAPDMIYGQEGMGKDIWNSRPDQPDVSHFDQLQGISVSAGYVEGYIKIVQDPTDVSRIAPGDILVLTVLDPGWAPLLGLAQGLIVEMGGTLSHGAIIAREYGIPTVVNVANAPTLLQEGEKVALDAARGLVIRLQPSSEQ